MQKRRSRNDGGLRWLEDRQLWEARYTIGYDEEGSPVRKSIYGKKNEKGIVSAKLRDCLAALGKGHYVDPSGKALGTWCREWYDTFKAANLRTNTRDKYETSMIRLARYDLALVPLKHLSQELIQKCYNKMAKNGNPLTHEGLGEETIKVTHALINGALEKAEELNMINKNPARYVTIPKAEDDHEDSMAKALTDAQCDAFLEHLGKSSKYYMYAFFMLNTGLRPGEALALFRSDVDTKKLTVSVTKTYLERVRKVQNATKTKSSRRTVSMPSDIVRIVQEHLVSLPNGKQDAPFFQTKTGKRPSQSYLRKRFKTAGKAIGCDWVNLHTMRHTYASNLFQQTVDIKVISALLGHKDVSTTYDIYVHFIDGMVPDAVQVLNARIPAMLPVKNGRKNENVYKIQ